MSLKNGDLTTSTRLGNWITVGSSAIVGQLISSSSATIRGKLNRGSLLVKNVNRSFDGSGNNRLVLPDWPVLSVSSLQVGMTAIQAAPLLAPGQSLNLNQGYGYRFLTWDGNLPGDPGVLEFVNGQFYYGQQNIKVAYSAGYGVIAEPAVVPTSPYTVTVQQANGICAADNGVVYASTGTALSPVAVSPGLGQYIPPTDAQPGLYTFSSFDAGAAILISYSFVPLDLEEACVQLIAERYQMRSQVGVVAQGLGGQESMSFAHNMGMPSRVRELIEPYISVLPPALGPLQ